MAAGVESAGVVINFVPKMGGSMFEYHTCSKTGCLKLAVAGTSLCQKHLAEETASLRVRSRN